MRILDLPIPYSVAKHTYLIANSRCRSPVWGTLPLRIEKKRAGGQLAFGLMRELVHFHVLSSHRCRKTFRVQLSFWRMIDPSSPQLPSVCGDLDPRGRQGASPTPRRLVLQWSAPNGRTPQKISKSRQLICPSSDLRAPSLGIRA